MKKVALLVGVEKYEDEHITPLRFAGADVRGLADGLRARCGFSEVRVFTEGDADGPPELGHILDALRDLSGELRNEDLFFFFFSGHGVEVDGQSYLMMRDSRQAWPQLGSLSMSVLRNVFEKLGAGRRVLLMDACRNDPRAGKGDTDNCMGDLLSKDIRATARAAPTGGSGTATALLSACHAGQRAYEWASKKHGVFTHFLLEGLNGPAWEKGTLEFPRLAAYAQREVSRWSRSTPGLNVPQDPWYEQFGVADPIVLADKQATTTATPPPDLDRERSEARRRHEEFEQREWERRQQELRQREVRERETREREVRDREHRERESRDREARERADHERRAEAERKRQADLRAKEAAERKKTEEKRPDAKPPPLPPTTSPTVSPKKSGGGVKALVWLIILGAFGWWMWHKYGSDSIKTLEGNTVTVTSVAFFPDNQRVISTGDRVRMWNIETGKEIDEVDTNHSAGAVGISPDGTTMLFGKGPLTLWNINSWSPAREFVWPTDRPWPPVIGISTGGPWVGSVSLSRDGRLALTVAENRKLDLWDVYNGTHLHRVARDEKNSVLRAALDPDGKWLLAVYGSTWNSMEPSFFRIWNLADLHRRPSGNAETEIAYETAELDRARKVDFSDANTAIALTPDGSRMLSAHARLVGTANEYTLRLWYVSNGSVIHTMTGHTTTIHGIAISPDGKYAVTAAGKESSSDFRAEDSALRVWDLASGKEIDQLKGHTRMVTCVAFSSDGKKIVSGSSDQTVRIWKAPQ